MVAIHNKNGKGLLRDPRQVKYSTVVPVAIHNKNGKGLLLVMVNEDLKKQVAVAIHNKNGKGLLLERELHNPPRMESQSTIKMEKGYYLATLPFVTLFRLVAIHNKNGKGLLQKYY